MHFRSILTLHLIFNHGQNKQMNQVSSIAAQAFSFLQLFELAITLSTPHLYVSALRFCPTELQVPTSLRLRFPL